MPFSDAINQAALDHMFQKATWTQPAAMEIALSTTTPTNTGTNITEPVGNGYARVLTAPADWTRTGLEMSNAAREDFPEATGSWGTVTHFVLFDSVSDAMIGFGALTASQAVATGQQPFFNAGDLIARYGV